MGDWEWVIIEEYWVMDEISIYTYVFDFTLNPQFVKKNIRFGLWCLSFNVMVTVMFIVIVIVIVIVKLLVFKRITLICEITLICVITLVCVILHVL